MQTPETTATMSIESICVYCASGPGNNPAFMDAARKLGRTLAENRIRLVYGGGSAGRMGAPAEAVLDHGGTLNVGRSPSFSCCPGLSVRPGRAGATRPT